MIIIDRELERREQEGRPIRVAMSGAGFIGRGIARHLLRNAPGIRLVAIANRTPENAERAFHEAGAESIRRVSSVAELEGAIERGVPAVTDDPELICKAGPIDLLVLAAGAVEFEAQVCVSGIEAGKHVVLVNAELDSTCGPILKARADRAGTIYTGIDGDQPGAIMNLIRLTRTLGLKPVLGGNVKGLYDPYRTPETQTGFAEAYGMNAKMASSFADGTKLAMEMALVANATGFRAGRRGMYGPSCDHVNEAPNLFPVEELLDGGLVDYVLGAEPGPGAFVVGYDEDPARAEYMKYLKMGDGPLYVFYTPYHLPHLEVAITIARAALFGDATINPLGAPVAETVTVAKRDLKAGEVLDGIGGFTCYGVIDNVEVCRADDLLPMGLSEGCTLVNAVPKDRAITFSDVTVPGGRVADALWAEQCQKFGMARGPVA
jgi:predicted homoserine dehydrogenase-like protein